MGEEGLHIFETAIGPCGVAWSARGITAVQFAQGTAEQTRDRLMQRRPKAEVRDPTPEIARVVEAVTALTEGEPADLSFAALDFGEAAAFERKVWAITHAIPPGQTLTYGDIARQLGDVSLSRAVGQALGANPIPIVVPCHRVLAADGKTGGFSAPGGVSTKLKLLNIERASTSREPMLFGDLPLETRRRP